MHASLWSVMLVVVCCGRVSAQNSTNNERNCTFDPYDIRQKDHITKQIETETNFRITCDGTPAPYVMQIVKGKYCNIKCYMSAKSTIDYIPRPWSGGIGHLRTYLLFEECPLPSKSYSDIMIKQLGVTSVKRLTIRGTKHTHTLNRTYLQGLEYLKIEQLVLESSKPILAVDTFEALPNILRLDLSSNEGLLLPDGILRPLKKLKILLVYDTGLRKLPELALPMLEELYLSYNMLNLTRFAFKNTGNLQILDLSSNSMKTLPQDLFKPLENLKYVDLSNNSLKTLSSDTFKYNKKMSLINLIGAQLTSLPELIFNGLDFLKNLILSNNKLEHLPENLFFEANNSSVNHNSLETLDFSHNSLRSLRSNIFKFLSSLEKLNLSHNNLTTLPPHIFNFLSSLKHLDLNHNKIASLESEHFEGLTSLKTLNVNYNQLKSIGFPLNLKITHLDASHNQLRDGSGGKSFFSDLGQLEELDLHNNSFKEFYYDWKARWALKHLRVLNLSRNKLNYISFDEKMQAAVNFVKNQPITVDLSHNSISLINLRDYEQQLMKATDYDVNVILTGNPVDCDCSLHYLYLYQEATLKRGVKFIIHDTECARPSSLKGRKLSNINPEELICQEKVNKCVMSMKPATSARILDCSDGNVDGPINWTLPSNFISYEKNVYLKFMYNRTEIEWYNHTELILENDGLTSIEDVGPIPDCVTVLKLNGNRLMLKAGDIPLQIQELDLRNNSLRYIDDELAEDIIGRERRKLKISNNPLECSCYNSKFISLLQHHNTSYYDVEDYDSIRCSDNRTLDDIKDLCIINKTIVPITVVTALAALIVIATISYYRYQATWKTYLITRYPRLRKHFLKSVPISSSELKYDVFISYSYLNHDDVKKINKFLEDLNYKTCLHKRDWLGGEFILNSIDKSIRQSQTTVFFLTEEFVKSVWSCHEFSEAFCNRINNRCDNMIVVVKGDAKAIARKNKHIKNYMKSLTYIMWNDREFYNKLELALPETLEIRVQQNRLKNMKLTQQSMHKRMKQLSDEQKV